MGIPGFYHRLLSHNTVALNSSLMSICIGNEPMPFQKLYCVVAVVFDGDSVGKNVVVLAWTGVLRLVLGLYTYLHALSCSCNHTFQKYDFFE